MFFGISNPKPKLTSSNHLCYLYKHTPFLQISLTFLSSAFSLILLIKSNFLAMGVGFVDGGGGGDVKNYPGKVNMYVIVTCIVGALGGLTFGYDIGISGKHQFNNYEQSFFRFFSFINFYVR